MYNIMCWEFFYYNSWVFLSYGYNDGFTQIGDSEPMESLWLKWDIAFDLQGWLNGACNNL